MAKPKGPIYPLILIGQKGAVTLEGVETVKKARAGSREAFITLIRQHESSLYAIASGILKSKQDTVDAVQETILHAYQGIVKLREPMYFRTWLTRILINECRRISKHNKRIIPVDEIYNHQGRSAEIDSNLELIDQLNGLDVEQKEIIVLYYMEDYSVKEITQILDLSESGVKSRLHRARLKLALLLKEPELMEGLQ
jgi:RNA polymerase sigma-70 factor, ECF subfamily